MMAAFGRHRDSGAAFVIDRSLARRLRRICGIVEEKSAPELVAQFLAQNAAGSARFMPF
jgi:hypothetical protein